MKVAHEMFWKSTKNLKVSMKNPTEVAYNASSPDEKAIVEACRNYGVSFLGEKEENGRIFSKLFLIQNSSDDQVITFPG